MSAATAASSGDQQTHRYQEPPLEIVSIESIDHIEVAPCRQCGRSDTHPIHRTAT